MRPQRPDSGRLRRLIADGLTPAQIAERLGFKPQTVRQWLREEGLTVARPRQKALGTGGEGYRVALPQSRGASGRGI